MTDHPSPEDARRLISKREDQRTLSWSELFPDAGHLYLTDEDEIEAIARGGRRAEDVVLSPLLAMEIVCDWRNMRAEVAALRAEREEAVRLLRQIVRGAGWAIAPEIDGFLARVSTEETSDGN